MLNFDRLVLDESGPIYLQILRYVKQGIAAGTIANGEELPSRRVVSALLGVNPNTVQKAYRLLEEEGLIRSHSGAKSYMVLEEENLRRIRQELVENDACGAVRMLKMMGVTKEEAMGLIQKYWDQGD